MPKPYSAVNLKTLGDLGVKAGDKVRCFNKNHSGTRFTIDKNWKKWGGADYPWWCFDARTPKIWAKMTEEEKGSLLLAWQENKTIESLVDGVWRDVVGLPKSWRKDVRYRVKEEINEGKQTKQVKLYGCISPKNAKFADLSEVDHYGKHVIVMDVTDGEVDLSSVRVERNVR